MIKRNNFNDATKIKEMPKKQSSSLYKSNRWKQASKNYLYKNPLCKMCEAKGVFTTSQETDHIKPHKGDEKLFWDISNWQALCKSCHSIKTAGETRSINRFPVFPMPSCKVVLVCDPIGSGRLLYARTHALNNDVVIDYAEIASKEFKIDRHQYTNQYQYHWAVNTRNSIVERLQETRYKGITAYIILDASTQAERKHWREQLNADVVVVLKDVDDIAEDYRDLAKQWWKGYTIGQDEKVVRY